MIPISLKLSMLQKFNYKPSSNLEDDKKCTVKLPPTWRTTKSVLESFLQPGGRQKVYWKPSSNLEDDKKFTGKLPPTWRTTKSLLESFLQLGGYCKSNTYIF
jgi:hypothetical protein